MPESEPFDTHLDAEIQQELGRAREAEIEFPATLPVLPLRGSVLFPGVVMPVLVGRKASQQLVVETMDADRLVAVVALRDAEIEEPNADDLHEIATLARLVKVLRLPNGNLNVIVQGIQRLRLDAVTSTDPLHSRYLERHPRAGCERQGRDRGQASQCAAPVATAHRAVGRLAARAGRAGTRGHAARRYGRHHRSACWYGGRRQAAGA